MVNLYYFKLRTLSLVTCRIVFLVATYSLIGSTERELKKRYLVSIQLPIRGWSEDNLCCAKINPWSHNKRANYPPPSVFPATGGKSIRASVTGGPKRSESDWKSPY